MKRKTRRRAQKQARQWTYYVEALKRSLDSLYEICRNEKNVSACREVMLYLTKGNRDFEALIESFVVENDFENGTKPQYAAWEIRQTAGVIEARGSETESSCSMISTDSLIDIMPYSPVLISDTIKKVTESLEKCDPDGGNEWQLVQSRRSRRYSSDSMGSYTTQVGDAEPEQKELDVYERLASSRSSRSCKKGAGASPLSHPNSELSNSRKTYTTGRLLFPKSAMDLPQTRSSMAKIAYSRRILWEQHRSILAEKMRKRHRQEHSRVNLQRPSSSQSNHETKMSSSNRQSSPLRAKSTISLELESIHEANEDEPLPTTRSEPAKEILASLDDDEEWRALTVEEESLAQEEMSLKKEIEEEESTSVDAELRRQVEAEAARVEALEKENAEPSRKRSTQVEKMSWKEALEKCTAKLQRHGISKWNDAVSKKIANFRPPGAVVQMHEKLMLPSRKRCGNNNTSNVEEKLQRAETMRQQLLEAKSFRLKELLKKVEQVKEKQTELVEKKRLLLEDLTLKMEKAEQNRQKTLNEIIRKAHDGDQKILEANFIKNMEENSVRMLMELREGEVEARKQQLEEERLKKSEQNAAVRFAAEKRREKQNEERSKQLQLLAERKRERQAQVDAQRQEAERTRQEQLREKHEKHQKRLATLKANQISDSQKLLNEITRKQEECAKRHEESLEVVKKRAIDSAQGCHSNRSSAVSTYSDEHSESSDTFALQFANPPSMERREGSLVMCKTCGSEMFTDLDTVAHAIFSDICPNSISNFGNASRIELECFQVDSVPETPRVIPIEPASQSIKKKRSKLRAKLSELYDAISSSFTKQNESSVPRRKGPRILSTKSMNLLAGFAKSVEENADSRLFSDTDLQSLLKAANEISIALVKAAKENPSQKQVAADLWHGGIVLQLVKLLLHFRFSPQVSFCSKAFEVVHSVISHIPLLACSLLYSPTYIRFMDCVSGVVKELSETPSKCSDELSELHTSLANLVSFNAILRSNSQHILISSSPTVSLDSIKEANANCVRYFSTLGFYAYLANYAQSVISSSTDFNRTEILFSLDSLIFFNCFHPDSPQFEFAIDSDSTKTLVFLLFQELISVIYRFIPQIPDSSSTSTVIPKSTSEEPDFHAFLQPLFASFIAIDKCLGKEKLSNLLKLEQPATAVQLLHILKMVAQNCLKPLTSQSKRSAEKLERSSSLSNFKLCMESLCRFITLGPEFQKLCSLGHENSLLYILATLDLPFYSNFALQRITAPPILALLCNNDENMQIFNKEISTDFLVNFLKKIKGDSKVVQRLLASLCAKNFEAIVEYFDNSGVKSPALTVEPSS